MLAWPIRRINLVLTQDPDMPTCSHSSYRPAVRNHGPSLLIVQLLLEYLFLSLNTTAPNFSSFSTVSPILDCSSQLGRSGSDAPPLDLHFSASVISDSATLRLI